MYLTGLAFINIISTAYFLRDMKTRSEKERQQRHLENSSNSSNDEESTDVATDNHYGQEKTAEDSTQKMIRKALASRTTVMCAFFVLFYVGKHKTKPYNIVLLINKS